MAEDNAVTTTKPGRVQVKPTERGISVHLPTDYTSHTGCRSESGADAVVMMALTPVKACTPQVAAADANETMALMAELAPRDAVEGILASQMVSVHRMAMECVAQANNETTRHEGVRDVLVNRSIKLMRLFTQQVEALDKHRRGGSQRMTIEHVHVHPGAQAVVGQIGGNHGN